jgi:formylglycine-generating enzyme required for sulfatase activity
MKYISLTLILCICFCAIHCGKTTTEPENIPTPKGDLVFVTGGTFTMGSSNKLDLDANPPHSVTLSDFSISATEISWGMWDTVYQWAINNGYIGLSSGQKGYTGDSTHPVTNVSWWDVVKWCNARSQKEGLTPLYYTSTSFTDTNIYKTGQIDLLINMVNWAANGYRLPTEAEWEYTARGGNRSNGYTYSGSNMIDTVAWYKSNSPMNTHQVGTKATNELGLYDMSGNVREWCWDSFEPYDTNAQTNPHGAAGGGAQVLRGGAFYDSDFNCRVAYRYYISHFPILRFGFRVVRTK